MAEKDDLGRAGEEFASQYLIAQGMRLLARNWRCSEGELDIVALDGRELVIVEVKTRTSEAFGNPLVAVTAVKQHRLWRLARAWAHANPEKSRGRSIRIDLIGVLGDPKSEASLDHLRDIR